MDFSLANVLSAVLVVGARVSGVMLFAPFLSSVAIPPRMKAFIAIAVTAVLYPVFSRRVQAIPVGEWPLLLGTELLVGIAIGITTNLVFDAAQMAGSVLSVQMGYSLVNILDPQTQVDTTVVSVFMQTMALMIFLSLDVHHWLLRAIARSFDYLPPGSGSPNSAFVTQLLHVGGSVLGIGIQIAAPVLVATLIADVLLGLLGKASPQMPVLFLGPAVKSLFGLVLLSSALRYWPDMFGRMFESSFGLMEQALHLAR
jgi:flagellar biosynthetic protein FliR